MSILLSPPGKEYEAEMASLNSGPKVSGRRRRHGASRLTEIKYDITMKYWLCNVSRFIILRNFADNIVFDVSDGEAISMVIF